MACARGATAAHADEDGASASGSLRGSNTSAARGEGLEVADEHMEPRRVPPRPVTISSARTSYSSALSSQPRAPPLKSTPTR